MDISFDAAVQQWIRVTSQEEEISFRAFIDLIPGTVGDRARLLSEVARVVFEGVPEGVGVAFPQLMERRLTLEALTLLPDGLVEEKIGLIADIYALRPNLPMGVIGTVVLLVGVARELQGDLAYRRTIVQEAQGLVQGHRSALTSSIFVVLANMHIRMNTQECATVLSQTRIRIEEARGRRSDLIESIALTLLLVQIMDEIIATRAH